jgi:hypothetical protein
MNRRDFIKSLGAAGLFIAVPRLAEPAYAEPTDIASSAPLKGMGRINRMSAYGTAKESSFGELSLRRDTGKAIVVFQMNAFGGMIEWRAPLNDEIIYTEDCHLTTSKDIEVHTVVHPLDGSSPMYWGAKWENGETIETWIPLEGPH